MAHLKRSGFERQSMACYECPRNQPDHLIKANLGHQSKEGNVLDLSLLHNDNKYKYVFYSIICVCRFSKKLVAALTMY